VWKKDFRLILQNRDMRRRALHSWSSIITNVLPLNAITIALVVNPNVTARWMNSGLLISAVQEH
jgi:hypothetical protein